LSLSGGSLKGIAEAALLAKIESVTQKPVSRQFDAIVGTSTGALLAVGLTVPSEDGKPKYSAAGAMQHYLDLGGIIFPAPVGDVRNVRSGRGHNCVSDGEGSQRIPCAFDGKALAKFIEEIIGDATLGDALTKVGIGVAVNLNEHYLPLFISTMEGSPYANWSKGYPMWLAADISSLFQPAFAPLVVKFPLSQRSVPVSLLQKENEKKMLAGSMPIARYFAGGPDQQFEVLDGGYTELVVPYTWLLRSDTKELTPWENEDVVIYSLELARRFSISADVYATYHDGNRVFRMPISVGDPETFEDKSMLDAVGNLPTPQSVRVGGRITVIKVSFDTGNQLTNANLAYLYGLVDDAEKLGDSDAFGAVLATLNKE
jgi:hypothetical protein